MKGIVSNFQKKRGSDGDGDGAARPFAGPAPSNTSFVSESEHVIDIDNAGSQALLVVGGEADREHERQLRATGHSFVPPPHATHAATSYTSPAGSSRHRDHAARDDLSFAGSDPYAVEEDLVYDDDNDLASFRDSRGGDSTDAESRIGDDVGGHNLHHLRTPPQFRDPWSASERDETADERSLAENSASDWGPNQTGSGGGSYRQGGPRRFFDSWRRGYNADMYMDRLSSGTPTSEYDTDAQSMRSHDRERPGHYGEYTEDNRTYDGDDARTYYTEDNATYTEDAQTYMGDDVSQYTRGGGDATSRGWESRSFSGYYPGTYEEDEGRSGPSYVSENGSMHNHTIYTEGASTYEGRSSSGFPNVDPISLNAYPGSHNFPGHDLTSLNFSLGSDYRDKYNKLRKSRRYGVKQPCWITSWTFLIIGLIVMAAVVVWCLFAPSALPAKNTKW